MQFDLPTTKTEMYDVLQELFYYYRIKKVPFEEITLLPLTLDRLTYTPLTDAEIEERAEALIMPEHKKRVEEYKSKLSEKKAALQSELTELQEKADEQEEEIMSRFQESLLKAEAEAAKKGMAGSSVALSAAAELAAAKQAAITELSANIAQKTAQINSEITAINALIADADDYYSAVFSAEAEAKRLELKEKDEELVREIFKYNNGIEEKEQKYANTIKQANASFALKYQEVNSSFLTKDQLVEMGYYEDVINCVCAYYDTLTALNAYSDMKSENKLCMYLDDYYESILYMYRMRAEV